MRFLKSRARAVILFLAEGKARGTPKRCILVTSSPNIKEFVGFGMCRHLTARSSSPQLLAYLEWRQNNRCQFSAHVANETYHFNYSPPISFLPTTKFFFGTWITLYSIPPLSFFLGRRFVRCWQPQKWHRSVLLLQDSSHMDMSKKVARQTDMHGQMLGTKCLYQVF